MELSWELDKAAILWYLATVHWGGPILPWQILWKHGEMGWVHLRITRGSGSWIPRLEDLVKDKVANDRPVWKMRGGERWLYLTTAAGAFHMARWFLVQR